MSCYICCENYNKSSRLMVVCPYCDFEACRICCETYILGETTPKCMNTTCGKEWSRKFLRENFTNVFLTTKFMEHLENTLFQQEKALMPATQPIIEEKNRKKKILSQITEIDKMIFELRLQSRALSQSLTQGDVTTKRREFVRQCPATGCRGFLSKNWKCGICEQWTCPECHELKGPKRDCEHKCDPNSVMTAELLAKDSRPCPKCQSMIFKISGCDQMWCTQCHTAFSWTTGNIETNIHNPHYYEWQRKNGGLERNPADIECGREINHYTYELIKDAANKHNLLSNPITSRTNLYTGRCVERTTYDYDYKITIYRDIVRHIVHNNNVELPRFQTDYVLRNEDLRVRYLENLISDGEFKVLIQRNDKKNRKNTEIAQVIQLANTATTDIIYRLIDHLKNTDENKVNISTFMSEIIELINYCNNIFKDIAFTYKSVQYCFNEKFEFTRIKNEKQTKKQAAHDLTISDSDDNSVDDSLQFDKIAKSADQLN